MTRLTETRRLGWFALCSTVLTAVLGLAVVGCERTGDTTATPARPVVPRTEDRRSDIERPGAATPDMGRITTRDAGPGGPVGDVTPMATSEMP